LIGGRVLIGVETAGLDVDTLLALGSAMGMPDAGLTLLQLRSADANAVFFGFEDQAGSSMCKVYLEFWDVVRREARRTGSHAPQLLHLGVKWDSARPAHYEVANYDCHPLLDLQAILRRMVNCYAVPTSPLLGSAQEIVRLAAQRNRSASMLYLEVSEQANQRASFDINLYKSALLVNDAATQLRAAGAYLRIAPALMEAQLDLLGGCPFGHLSSGVDRHGREFLSVYAEIAPLS
jgi:hypothetical protein